MRGRRDIRVAVTIFIAIALALLFPGMSVAGPIEPTDPPGPTMHTLDELYNKPVWKMFDKVFTDWPANPRFAVCDNGTTETRDDMVLDKETGLVWERDTTAKTSYETLSLDWALLVCNEMERYSFLGRGDGWRLPTLQELASLIDRTHYYPVLPSGHPFLNVNMEDYYWTATPAMHCERVPNAKAVYTVYFGNGIKSCYAKEEENRVWCVRGGPSFDGNVILWVTQ